jgi:hypothetical protein
MLPSKIPDSGIKYRKILNSGIFIAALYGVVKKNKYHLYFWDPCRSPLKRFFELWATLAGTHYYPLVVDVLLGVQDRIGLPFNTTIRANGEIVLIIFN